jgi:hypothetical protein
MASCVPHNQHMLLFEGLYPREGENRSFSLLDGWVFDSSVLSFGHCIVCPSVFWPLYCLSFCLLAIVLSVLLSFGHCIVCPSVFALPCDIFNLFLLIHFLFQFILQHQFRNTFQTLLNIYMFILKLNFSS